MRILTQLTNFIRLIKETVHFFRVQDFYHGYCGLDRIIFEIKQFPDKYISELAVVLNDILAAQNNKDNILVADLLEAQLMYYIENTLQEIILSEEPSVSYLEKNLSCLKDRNLSDMIRNNVLYALNSPQYSVEVTNMGVYTVKLSEDNAAFYYHSNLDPFSEGELLAKYYGKDKCFNYNVFGFGFGYHVGALLDMDRRCNVTAIENNLEVITLAFLYCDLEDILTNTRFKLLYCDEAEVRKTLLKCNKGEENLFIIHYPSLRAIKDITLRQTLENYFINVNSMLGQKKYLDWNFYYNIKLNDEPVDEVLNRLSDKSVIYIGGGPSLEYNLDYLKSSTVEKEKILMCASTIYKKLLNNSIIPDYVVMIDAKDNMLSHIEGTPETKTSMLYLCTASASAVREFKGKRYIIFQNGYGEAEKYANENNCILTDTGGSVSTTAIDMILRAGCKELVTLGMDLAYTDNKRHFFDESLLEEDITNKLISVNAVDGGMVPTTNILNIYRHWIERRIENIKDISLINVSRGAFIKGMKNVTEI